MSDPSDLLAAHAAAPRTSCVCGAGASVSPHGQRNPLALFIDFQHLDFDHLPHLDYRVRVFHEFVSERGDVHQSILMHSDIDER